MKVFADTSGLFASLVADDDHHAVAHQVASRLLAEGTVLVTSSAVVLETVALLQARVGLAAAQTFERDFVPRLAVQWVEAGLFEMGVNGWRTRSNRGLSLVDCISFALMEVQGLEWAFSFDRHFAHEGFKLLAPDNWP